MRDILHAIIAIIDVGRKFENYYFYHSEKYQKNFLKRKKFLRQ